MFDYVSLATYKSTRGHPYKLFVNRMHSCIHGHFLFNVTVLLILEYIAIMLL